VRNSDNVDPALDPISLNFTDSTASWEEDQFHDLNPFYLQANYSNNNTINQAAVFLYKVLKLWNLRMCPCFVAVAKLMWLCYRRNRYCYCRTPHVNNRGIYCEMHIDFCLCLRYRNVDSAVRFSWNLIQILVPQGELIITAVEHLETRNRNYFKETRFMQQFRSTYFLFEKMLSFLLVQGIIS
jgi:hypothetical protein